MRAEEIARDLLGLRDTFQPSMLAMEALTFPRGARAARMLSLVHGVVVGVAVGYLTAIHPKSMRMALGSAGKEDFERLAKAAGLDALLDRVSRARRQHAYDAWAVAETARRALTPPGAGLRMEAA